MTRWFGEGAKLHTDKCDEWDFDRRPLEYDPKGGPWAWDSNTREYIQVPTVVKYHEDDVIDEVVKKFLDRADKGMYKYKTTMADNKGDTAYWLNHLQEELMDAVNYITRLKREFK